MNGLGFHGIRRLAAMARRLSENSVRREKGRKLKIKMRFCEANSELFNERKRIFRSISCLRTTAWMQELEQRMEQLPRRAVYSRTAS